VMIKGVVNWLTNKCSKEKADVKIIASSVHTEPFTFL